jgi:flagellar M-ring protein FliF
MGSPRKLYDALSVRQRFVIGAAAILVVAAIYGAVYWSRESSFVELFKDVPPEEAGQITARLKERGVEHRLGKNGTQILVPAAQRDEMRIELAGEGLPKTGRIGFELFDKVNLGTTDFAEQVNYHRAVEGELARSVMALKEVESARVHITFPKDSIFAEARRPAKASVMIKLKNGDKLAPASVQAIMHLAASAVEGLQPEMVSVIDMQGRALLNRPKKPSPTDGAEPDDAQIEFRQKVERDILAKVNASLEPLVGPDRYRSSASVEVDFSSGEQSEETFDPTRSVMAAQQRTEDVSGGAAAAGVPGTASSLPRPTSRPGESGRNVARRTENITYQSTRTVRHMKLPQGSIRRISLSVLVDQNLRWEGVGPKARRILEPPPPERLKKIQDIVSAAVGLQTQRGDQLIVESLPFEATLNVPPPDAPAAPPSAAPVDGGLAWPAWLPAPLRDLRILGAITAGVAAAIAIGLFLLMRKRKGKGKTTAAAAPGQIAGGAKGASAAVPAVEAGAAPKSIEEQLAERRRQIEADAIAALKLPEPVTKKGEVFLRAIAEEAKKDPAGIAHILRSWLEEDGFAR